MCSEVSKAGEEVTVFPENKLATATVRCEIGEKKRVMERTEEAVEGTGKEDLVTVGPGVGLETEVRGRVAGAD